VPVQSQPPACPFCGAARHQAGLLPPDRLAPDSAPVALIRCTGCGTFESLSEEPAADVVADTYLPHARPAGLQGRLTARSQDRKVARCLPWAGEGGLVDLGCGIGGFLAAWKRARPADRPLGLETDPGAVQLARSRGLDVEQIDLEAELPETARKRSLYTLWHVLEHLSDPAAVLRAVREAMLRDGHIILAVPNAAALERSVFRTRTIAWDPPRHRWHFTPQGLTELARLSGLTIRDRFSLLSDDIYDAVASQQWALWPRFWVEERALRRLPVTGLALLGGIPAGLALAAVAPWGRRASLGVVLGKE